MRTINRIIIHHTAGNPQDTVEQIRKYHKEQRGWSDIGYHYCIRQTPGEPVTVELGRPKEQIGAHSQGENHDSIAVCVFGNWVSTPLPQAQKSVLLGVLVALCKQYKLGVSQVFGHKECPGEATACPGFDPNMIRSELAKLLA
jgi:N-acetylmuramoyl-L-alanine amidase